MESVYTLNIRSALISSGRKAVSGRLKQIARGGRVNGREMAKSETQKIQNLRSNIRSSMTNKAVRKISGKSKTKFEQMAKSSFSKTKANLDSRRQTMIKKYMANNGKGGAVDIFVM